LFFVVITIFLLEYIMHLFLYIYFIHLQNIM